MSRARLVFLLAVVLAIGGCKDSTKGPQVAQVHIVPSQVNVQRNQTRDLYAVLLDAEGDTIQGAGVRWRVVDATIASVTGGGTLKGLASGSTSLIATAGGAADTAMVIVSGINNGSLISDDFIPYANTAALLGNTGSQGLYGVAANTNLAEIDQSVRYQGHQTLKMTQPANGSTEALVLFVYPPQPLADMWLRTKLRFSPGWQPTTAAQGGVDALMHWGWSGIVQRGELDLRGDGRYELRWFAEGATAPVTADAGAAGSEFTSGQWLDVIVRYQRLSETATRTRVWMAPDGQTPVLRATVDGTMPAGSSAPRVDRVRLTPEYRWPVATTQAVWLGQWEVWDGAQNANPFNVGTP